MLMKSVLVQQMTGDDQRARQRGLMATGGDHRRRAYALSRLRDTDHRPLGQLPRRQQSRVAEAGDHMPIHPLLASGPDLLQHADRRDESFVKVALGGTPARGQTARISVPGAATARAAAPIVSVIARLVLGLITCIRTEDITTPCGRRTAGKNRAG